MFSCTFRCCADLPSCCCCYIHVRISRSTTTYNRDIRDVPGGKSSRDQSQWGRPTTPHQTVFLVALDAGRQTWMTKSFSVWCRWGYEDPHKVQQWQHLVKHTTGQTKPHADCDCDPHCMPSASSSSRRPQGLIVIGRANSQSPLCGDEDAL